MEGGQSCYKTDGEYSTGKFEYVFIIGAVLLIISAISYGLFLKKQLPIMMNNKQYNNHTNTNISDHINLEVLHSP